MLSDSATNGGATDAEHKRQFVETVLKYQNGLFTYILTLLPDPDAASDVLQQTNLVLWRDADKFAAAAHFKAWAYKVAYYQVLTYRKERKRSKLTFDVETVERLAQENAYEPEALDERREQLAACLEKLSADDRQLICRRYMSGEAVQAIADEMGKSPNSVSAAMYRIRRALLDCMKRFAAEGWES